MLALCEQDAAFLCCFCGWRVFRLRQRVLRLVGDLVFLLVKAEGWSGLKQIILGARQHILDGGVREILAEEAGRKTITE